MRFNTLILAFTFLVHFSYGQSINKLIDQAKNYEKDLKYIECAKTYDTIVKLFVSENEISSASEYNLHRIRLLIQLGKFNEAEQICLEWKKKYPNKLDLEHLDKINEYLTRIYIHKDSRHQALEFVDKVVAFRKQKFSLESKEYIEALNLKAKVSLMHSDYNQALALVDLSQQYAESLNPPSDSIIIDVLYTRSAVLRFLTMYEQKDTVLKKLVVLSESLYGEKHPVTAAIYHSYGLNFKHLAQSNKSIQYNEKSIEIRKNLFGKDYPLLASNYNTSAANYLSINDHQKCVESAREANRIAALNFGDKHTQALRALGNIAISYNLTGKTQEAISLNKNILAIRETIFESDHEELAKVYQRLGTCYKFVPDYAQSIKYYEKAIETRLGYWDKNALLSDTYWNLANSNVLFGQFHEGIKNSNQSFLANNLELENIDYFDWPDIEGYISFPNNFWAGAFKIYCLYSLADQKRDSSIFYYESALRGCYFLDALVQDRIKRVVHTDDKFRYSEHSHRAMELGFWSAHYLFELTQDEQYLDDVFYFNERSKANMLLVKSQTGSAQSFAGVPDNLVQEEIQLNNTIEKQKSVFLDLTTNYPNLTKQITEAKLKLIEAEEKLVGLERTLKNDYPNYFELKHQTKPVNSAKVKEFLKRQNKPTALIEYLIRQGNVYGTLMTSDTIVNFNVRYGRSNFMKDKVVKFRNALLNLEDSAFLIQSNHLYSLLIADIRPLLDSAGIEALTVIPDGPLFYVPFEILSADSTDRGYLMDKFDISYANSATLLLKSTVKKSTNNMISFAPDFKGQRTVASLDVVRSELSKLPGALNEVNALSDILDNQAFINQEATETNFRKNAQDYGMIHLATHAIVDENSAESARLVFNLEADSTNDGYLYPHEIYNLELNAQLVTLSACNTGFGKIKKGEGVMSLSRAFAYAGVPATVVSLWPASDKSTPELMKYFYQNLADGQAKDIALNNARKQYLSTATGKARHPFYWGGFVLIGDNTPIKKGVNMLLWFVPMIIGVFAMFALFAFRGKRGRLPKEEIKWEMDD